MRAPKRAPCNMCTHYPAMSPPRLKSVSPFHHAEPLRAAETRFKGSACAAAHRGHRCDCGSRGAFLWTFLSHPHSGSRAQQRVRHWARREQQDFTQVLEHFSVDLPEERARRQYAQYGEREET